MPSYADDFIPKISVEGMAKVEVVPDRMNWQISVSHKDRGLESLASKHANTTSTVLSALKELGVEKKTLKANQMSFSEDWSYINNQRVKNGYVASTSISFELADFSRYLDIWKKISQYPEVSLGSVTYSFSKRDEIEQDIKSKALLNAKEKAEQMTKTLGVHLGQVIYISDSTTGGDSFQPRMLGELSSFAKESAPVEPGIAEIRSNVRVEFRILSE